MRTDTIRDRVRTAYDAIAPAFAARYEAMPPLLFQMGERLLDRLGTPATLLDAGCGHGRDMAWFEGHGVTAIGLDLSMGMLSEARRRVQGPLVQGDLHALPFSDGRFGAVWCMVALLHLPKTSAPAALRELHRVLTMDGLLVLGLQEGGEEVWQPDPFGAGVERFFARYSIAEVENLLAHAGFTVIELDTPPMGASRSLLFLASANGSPD